MSRIDEIVARAEAAPTPDVYVPGYNESKFGAPVVNITRSRDSRRLCSVEFCPTTKGNVPFAEFLAHAVHDVPWLLARVRELEVGLHQYGQHGPGCWYLPRAAIEGGDTEPCTCGLMAVLAGEA